MSILLLTVLIMPSSVFATELETPVTETYTPRVICDKGCGGMAYYICNHSWVYNPDHSYYHGKCFVRVYNCTYTGFKCEFCDHIQSAGSLNLSGAHLCHYIHSSCGAGALRYCKEGQYI